MRPTRRPTGTGGGRAVSRAGWARGQLVVPAAFVLPTLFLFVYLIFETAKLSREKIRHQFGVDSAAFIEMTNYSDLLNRSAYVNGAFPWKVFIESYPPSSFFSSKKDSEETRDIQSFLYENGAFPAGYTPAYVQELPAYDTQPTWSIKYAPSSKSCPNCDKLNDNTTGDLGITHVTTFDNAYKWNVWYTYKDGDKGIARILYEFFLNVYSLLGSVEDAQIRVYERLAKERAFYIKSWYLNTGLGKATANVGAQAFGMAVLDMRGACKFTSKGGAFGIYFDESQLYSTYDPFVETGFGDDPDIEGEADPVELAGLGTETCPGGIFRVAVVEKSQLAPFHFRHGGGRGVLVEQPWPVPANYFGVAFKKPKVRARVGVVGCCVWAEEGSPQPTPKFQTRLLP